MQLLIHFFNYWPRLYTIRRTYWLVVTGIIGFMMFGSIILGHFYWAFIEIGIFTTAKASILWMLIEFIFLMSAIIHIGQMAEVELPEDIMQLDWDDTGEIDE